MATVATTSIPELCAAAKRAARRLAAVDTAVKDAALLAIADALIARTPEILGANELDMGAGRESGIGDALLDRLALDPGRIGAIASAVRQIAALPDPVGEVIDGRRLPNGLDVRKVRVPLGVIAVVYEARPNVTIDAAALCLKAGNAIVLRGSSTAAHSNAVLAAIASEAAVAAGLPVGCVSLVAGGGREELAELATQTDTVDLVIPRGGEGLKAALKEVATVPVIYAASGNCHVYVDATADLDAAERIVLNAKVQRPGVCNAAETLLVHRDAASAFIPRAVRALHAAGVLVRGDERTLALAAAGGALGNGAAGGGSAGAGVAGRSAGLAGGDAAAAGAVGNAGLAGGPPVAGSLLEPATEEDWATEYLALTLAVRVVDSVAEAIEHIGRYGSGHSEAILTRDTAAARAFQLGVDAACVYVNASTRFTDGGEFGMGAEIGNSTQKLHARGPIGLRELCTFKYLVEGDGHVRA
ncbi:MAG TPA: glutamate-5-semialdehyde dehydrogenase [Solirubrobacteraceae bacterium]|jgi:glutamate-5-semialdehyde dehydrogenase|nr:glutamate-5-semialdehyde dehydrogenase [Solirubrobacteraceae bacterium]